MDMFEFVRWGEDLDTEFSGASDRGAAVVGAAMLDAQLRVLLDAYLANIPTKTHLFEDAYAPLHSFSGKTDLALTLGIISVREHRNLTLIRRIRNQFAHGIGNLSFEAAEISARCNELEVPELMRFPEKFPLEFLTSDGVDPSRLPPVAFSTPRERFQVTVGYMSNCLNARFIEAIGSQRTPRPEYERPSQITELELTGLTRLKKYLEGLRSQLNDLKSSSRRLEPLLSKENVDEDTKSKVESLRDQVVQMESAIEEQEKHPSLRIVEELTEPMLQRILEFMRRWEEFMVRQ